MHHPPSAQPVRVALVDFGAGDHGHRREYNRLFGDLFGARLRPWQDVLFDSDPVLVTMIEQSFERRRQGGRVGGDYR